MVLNEDIYTAGWIIVPPFPCLCRRQALTEVQALAAVGEFRLKLKPVTIFR